MSRAPRPADLYTLRVPADLRLSPDGRRVAFVIKESDPDLSGYRQSIWLVPSDGSAPPRRLTLGAKKDTAPRWSPDGRTLAFLSDRGAVLRAGGAADQPRDPRAVATERGSVQVWLLPLDGGEATQLTRFPEDVEEMAWSPDGRRLCVVCGAASTEPRRTGGEPGEPPAHVEPDRECGAVRPRGVDSLPDP